MDTFQFLQATLPEAGFYFLVTNINKRFEHHAFQSKAEMAQTAIALDRQNKSVYFACASYKQKSYITDNGKTKYRTADNACQAKSFWLDIDCGEDKAEAGKGYRTQTEAIEALTEFCEKVRISKPMIVSSGHGIHCYWLLKESISKHDWLPLAQLLKSTTQQPETKLLADDSRTADIASILRPAGTRNFKHGEPKAVEVIYQSPEVTFSDFSQAIHQSHAKHGAASAKPPSTILNAVLTYPTIPETPEYIAYVESALATIDPDCERDKWRDICFAIHALNWQCGKELAREWSKGALR